MLSAVGFDGKPTFSAIKIKNETIHWELSAKLEPTQLSIAKHRPKLSLSVRLGAAHFPREADIARIMVARKLHSPDRPLFGVAKSRPSPQPSPGVPGEGENPQKLSNYFVTQHAAR